MNIFKTQCVGCFWKTKKLSKKKDLKTREYKGNDNVVKFEHSSEPLGNCRITY